MTLRFGSKRAWRMTDLLLDPFTTSIQRGDTGRGRLWGLNLNLCSPPPSALARPYAQLVAALRAGALGSPAFGAYFYPFPYLHITCAAPAPFTKCDVTLRERPALVAAWAAALSAAAQSGELPAGPFPLVFGTPTLGRAAAIFPVEDPTGSVARTRAVITACFETSAEVAGLPATLRERCCFSIPHIVHSTFLRFGDVDGSAASGGGSREKDSVAAMRAEFEATAAGWQPITVEAEALHLVEEVAAYMHLDLAGEDADKIVLSLPFGGGRE